MLVDVSTAASSPFSYLWHFRPPQGGWRAGDDRKSAQTNRGQSGGSRVRRGVSRVSHWLPPLIERLTERQLEVFSIQNSQIVPTNVFSPLWSWTARGATRQRVITRHVSLLFHVARLKLLLDCVTLPGRRFLMGSPNSAALPYPWMQIMIWWDSDPGIRHHTATCSSLVLTPGPDRVEVTSRCTIFRS